MSYNDGAVKDVTKINDKRKAAHDFAEGNNFLEELLNNCFDKGIITTACCAGHRNTGHDELRTSYIAFNIVKENEIYIYNILNYLIEKGYRIELCSHTDKYPTLIIRANTKQDYNQFFVDINNCINNIKNNINKEELSEYIKKILSVITRYNTNFDFNILKNGDKYNIELSFENFYEIVVLDLKDITNYLDSIFNKYNIISDDSFELQKYDSNYENQNKWIKFQEYLKHKNIKLKYDYDYTIISQKGVYSDDFEVKCELEVLEDDTIYSVAKKLNDLLYYRVYAKATINNFEFTNADYVKGGHQNGRDTYISSYSMADYIKKYEKFILDKLNREYFNNELIVIHDGPYSIISFSNPNLSDEELSKRIALLKENKLDIYVRYENYRVGLGYLSINESMNIDNLKNNILYSICGTISLDLIMKLLDLYRYLNNIKTNEQLEQAFKYYKSLVGYDWLDINVEGKYNYINGLNNNRFMSLKYFCLKSRIIPLIEYYKEKFNNSDYLEYIIEYLNNFNITDKIVNNLINCFFNYYYSHSHELDENEKKVI